MTKKESLTLRLVVLILCLVLFLGSALFYVFKINKEGWNINMAFGGNEAMLQNTVYEKEAVQRLEIKTAAADVYLKATDDEKLSLTVYGRDNAKDDPVQISLVNGVLCIKETPVRKLFSFFSVLTRIEIAVPKNLCPQASVETASGDVRVAIDTNTLHIASASGDAEIFGSCGDRLTVSQVSGEIKLSSSAKEMLLSSISGDMELQAEAETLEAKTVSGDIDLSVSERCKTVSAHTTSGDITASIGAVTDYKVSFESVSGSFNDRKNGSNAKKKIFYTVGTGALSLSFHTVSGDATVR